MVEASGATTWYLHGCTVMIRDPVARTYGVNNVNVVALGQNCDGSQITEHEEETNDTYT